MFRAATIRLTAWYLVIIMLISLLFSVVLYQALSAELDRGYRRQSDVLRTPLQPSPQPFFDRARFESLRREQLQTTKRHIEQNVLFINLAIFLLGAGASYLLARRTLRPIQETLDAQSRFTADASHELRTPLAAMRAEIEVALRGQRLTGDGARALLGSNLEEIGKLEALSAALLKLADYQNGIPEAAKKPIRVRELLAEAEKKVAGLAKRHQVTISAATGNLRVIGDRASLVELFVILLDNAIKYSSEGTAVKIKGVEEGHMVRVTVADQGIGIKASDIPHLFSRFYRADTSRSKRNVPGFGLGLSLAERIVETHKGKISVTSTPNQGSTFTVMLPGNAAKGSPKPKS